MGTATTKLCISSTILLAVFTQPVSIIMAIKTIQTGDKIRNIFSTHALSGLAENKLLGIKACSFIVIC
jgi:ABC-type dipeptide/oligopeptide/nickel transport system permease component